MEDFLSYADKLRKKQIDKYSAIISEVTCMINTSPPTSKTIAHEYILSTRETSSSSAEACLTMRPSSLTRDRMKLESYRLVWLTSDFLPFSIENSEKSFKSERFSPFIYKAVQFNDVEECLEYLQHSEKYGIVTILVCCGSLVEKLLPKIPDYTSIRSIYIVYQHGKDYAQLAVTNPKVTTKNRLGFLLLNKLLPCFI